MIIDTHIHLMKPFDSKGKPQIYSPGNPASAEDYIAQMNNYGIDKAFFISWSPEDIPSDLRVKNINPDVVREVMNRDYAMDVMKRFPDKFYWFPCHLNPQNPDYIKQAKENLEMGATGFKLVCSFWGEFPDEKRLLPIYELAREHRKRVIIDTSFWYLGIDDPKNSEEIQPEFRKLAARTKDFKDYSSHLINIFKKYPDINFSLAHSGARDFTKERAIETGNLIRSFPNVFADTGAVAVIWDENKKLIPYSEPAFDILVESAGPDKIMFGTDWPHFAQGAQMELAISQITKPGRFDSKTQKMILGENALQFLGK